MKELNHTWGYIPLLLVLSLLGIILVAVGISSLDPKLSLFFIAAGAALFGACLGGVFTGFSERKLTNKLLLILERTNRAKVTSKEADIRSIKKRWYHYGVSKMDDKLFWRLSIYDFSLNYTVGQLTSVVIFHDNLGRTIEYKVEGVLRDQRMVLLICPSDGTEPTTVEVYPFMGKQYESIQCGFWLETTWDGDNALYPVIMSEKPLHNCKNIDYIPEDKIHLFDTTWKSGIKGVDFSSMNAKS